MWNTVYNRRKGIIKAVGAAGGVYLATRFISQRLDDMRQSVVQDKIARETLRRRYQQTQDDISYTVMALLPTLAEQILSDMDVERLTEELKNMSKQKSHRPQPEVDHAGPSSMSDFLVPNGPQSTREDETRSEASADSFATTSDSQAVDATSVTSPNLSSSTTSWVDNMSSTSSIQEMSSPGVGSGLCLSDSITSVGSGMTSMSALSESSAPSVGRTKAEVWKELKILSISRALTAVYSVTFLTLLTSVQLSQLARRRYVSAIRTMEKEERRHSSFSLASLFFPSLSNFSLDEFLDGDKTWEDAEVDQSIEHMFLTLSWWLLHIGWKELSHSVTSAVREVFMGVSLKTHLTSADLTRLVNDVRRSVERDGSKVKSLIDLIIPCTEDQVRTTLVSGGVMPTMASNLDDELEQWLLSQPQLPDSSLSLDLSPSTAPLPPVFTSLHHEAARTLSSPEVDDVLASLISRSMDLLLDDIHEVIREKKEVGQDETRAEMRLAELLPSLSSWAQTNLNSLPNRLVDKLLAQPGINSLSAIIYSQYQDDMT
jgi:peroxin-3